MGYVVEDASNRAATAPRACEQLDWSLFVGWTGLWGGAMIPADEGKLGQRREGSSLVLHHLVHTKVP